MLVKVHKHTTDKMYREYQNKTNNTHTVVQNITDETREKLAGSKTKHILSCSLYALSYFLSVISWSTLLSSDPNVGRIFEG